MKTRSMRQLARKKLDQRLAPLRALPPHAFAAPHGGWIRAIREALGMPRHELGRRMQVGAKRIAQLERGEAEVKVSIEALRRAAEALDCDLVVALVPRRPLEETVANRRMQLASTWLRSNALHNMAMENQAVSAQDLPNRLLREIEEQFPDERLWDGT